MAAELTEPAPAQRPVRASDAERAEAVARLQHAMGEGRLDLAETDARITTALAARYRADLEPLLVDLPEDAPATPAGAPSWPDVWRSAVWRARDTVCGRATETAPTPAQYRNAALLVLLGLLWFVVCAFLGAAVMA